MVKGKTIRCTHGVDPRKCKYGKPTGETIYCPQDYTQDAWERHPERHSDFPIRPSPGECQYPELFGKDLTKKPRGPYKGKLPSLPGPYCDLKWLEEVTVPQK